MCDQGSDPPRGGSRGESVFLPFPASRGCSHSLALDPLLSSKSSIAGRVFSLLCHPDPYFYTFKDTVITLVSLGHNPGKSPYFKVS